MTVNGACYLIKPLLPWSVRLILRRRPANIRTAAFAEAWPIDEAAGTTPPNWPGWPCQTMFAVILTHDVEGERGHDRVPQLMEIERKHGFRSSFTFVPRGEYTLPEKLPRTPESNGFEVGLHGLEHDRNYINLRRRLRESSQDPRVPSRLERLGLPLAAHASPSGMDR